jgi:hypothetical protein
MEQIQPALTPLVPFFDIIDTVVAVFNCVKAIPDSLGPPPDPTVLAACIPELAEKVNEAAEAHPAALAALHHHRDHRPGHRHAAAGARSAPAPAAADAADPRRHRPRDRPRRRGAHGHHELRAGERRPGGGERRQEPRRLGKLIGILNLFLGMVGAPEVPDLSDLAGRPLDEVIPPIDAIVEALQDVRGAVPVP